MSHNLSDTKSSIEQSSVISANVFNAKIFSDLTNQHFQKISTTHKVVTLKFLQEKLQAEEKRTLALLLQLKEVYEALISEALTDLEYGKKLINRGIKFNSKHPNKMQTAAYFRCAHESFKESKKNFTRGLFLYENYMQLSKENKDEVYSQDIQTLIGSASQYYQDSYACLRGFIRHLESISQKKPTAENKIVSKGYFPGLSSCLTLK